MRCAPIAAICPRVMPGCTSGLGRRRASRKSGDGLRGSRIVQLARNCTKAVFPSVLELYSLFLLFLSALSMILDIQFLDEPGVRFHGSKKFKMLKFKILIDKRGFSERYRSPTG